MEPQQGFKSDGENFASILQKIMVSEKINIIEAITSFSETAGVELADIIPVLDKHTIEKIRLEAVQRNLILEPKPRSLYDIATV